MYIIIFNYQIRYKSYVIELLLKKLSLIMFLMKSKALQHRIGGLPFGNVSFFNLRYCLWIEAPEQLKKTPSSSNVTLYLSSSERSIIKAIFTCSLKVLAFLNSLFINKDENFSLLFCFKASILRFSNDTASFNLLAIIDVFSFKNSINIEKLIIKRVFKIELVKILF